MKYFRNIVERLLLDLETDLDTKMEILLKSLNDFLDKSEMSYQIHKFVNPPRAEPCQDKRKPNCCSICESTFKKHSSLVEHVHQNHLGFCWICGVFRGYEVQEIIAHNRKEHLAEFTYICQHCGHNFSRNQQYKIHVLKRHGNASDTSRYRKYSCTDCEGKFRSLKQLDQHLKESSHQTTSQYFCKKCDITIEVQEKLKHKCKEKTKTCNICSTTFETRSNMLRHRERHSKTEKDFVCHQCGAKYYSVDSLKEHCFLAHSLQEEIMFYQCDRCEKKYRLKRLLKRHVQSHFTNGNFKCEPCDKTYETEAQFDRHNRNTHKLRKKRRKIDAYTMDGNGEGLKAPTAEIHRNEKLVGHPGEKQPPPNFEIPPTVFAIELNNLLPVAPHQAVKVLHYFERI